MKNTRLEKRTPRLRPLTIAGILLSLPVLCGWADAGDAALDLALRIRKEAEAGKSDWRIVETRAAWDPAKTAAVVCDMWDRHWCQGATARVAEMAPRMNDLLVALRRRGALIVHCPSDTMKSYADHPGRKLALAAPKAETTVPLKGWCGLDPAREGPLPIDDSDGGCACDPTCKQGRAWSRQIDVLKIEEGDGVADGAEAYHLMKQRGVTHVLVLGVHTNMCVLGRPFAIRQLVLQGMQVALVRDLTDTMYNPKRKPFVDHFAGTDLVVEHIEKHWCPTVTSDQVLGGAPFRFAQSPRCDALPADAPAGPERDGSPVVLQATLGENACGPCAVVNTLLRARAPYADVLRAVEGGTPLEKAGGLVRRFGQAPSEAYAGEMAYVPKRGITWTDLTTCVNALLKERQAPPLAGDYLDRRRDEPLDDHLRRVHRLLASSIQKGVPVVVSVRSFAPEPKEGGEHAWKGLDGHYVVVTAVPERIDDGEKGFRFTYADSFTGRLETGYAHVDEARNFTAAKGDEKRWEWLTDRPFLLVTAPTLRLSTQKQPWQLRTIITINYAVYAPE